MSDDAIKCQALIKSFRTYKKPPGITGSFKSFFKRDYQINTAVNNFNLNIKHGEIVGLLGPNGAGKTTLMKMFTGIIVPTSGELSVLGFNPWERDFRLRKRIALVMGQKSQLWWDIPAMDSLILLQKYYEIPAPEFNRKVATMAELLGVEQLLHIHVRKLSLGERMKMELMASLLHSPDIIFLDEPTIGLDLVAQESVRKFVFDYHQKNGCTLILTSHYMVDVQELCKRIVLIFKGVKAYDGPIGKFETILGNEKNVTFRFDRSQDPTRGPWSSYNASWNEDNTSVDILLPQENLGKVGAEILSNFNVTDFHTEKMPVERVMKTLMRNPEIIKVDEA